MVQLERTHSARKPHSVGELGSTGEHAFSSRARISQKSKVNHSRPLAAWQGKSRQVWASGNSEIQATGIWASQVYARLGKSRQVGGDRKF